ncbi:MAG: ATP-dependent Clp protease ATP-binding subunit ClpA, partial [Deltaproteobacteria bacterium]|nr:ATP-dependent Clp protease ATP-binding subunit ClpA [Deltaproteobacteria bacterium]
MVHRELQLTFARAVTDARQRRHELLCLEHVLLAMLEDLVAVEILQACGADLAALRRDLEAHLEGMDQVPPEVPVEVEQTVALTRVLQRAALHVQSSGKEEIEAGDVLAAIFQEPDSYAVYLLKSQGVSRLDILEYISHGVTKDLWEPDEEWEEDDEDDDIPFGSRQTADPLEAFTTNLVARAAEGKLDPLIGRLAELRRTMHVLCRRRKNNPIFVGETGVGKTAMAEGLALA